VRYADGHTVHARIGHKDAALDLALLIPLSGRYVDGLPASESDPAAVEVKSFGVGAQNKPSVAPAKVKGRVHARAKDNTELPNLLDFDAKTALLPGAPLIDPSGSVVGVTVRECRAGDAGPCAPITVAQPIAAIRNFLVRTPVNAVPPSPWLGIQGAPDTTPNQHGVRVLAIAPSSPAQSGGLKPQDLIFIVDGQPVETPERLQELIAKHAVGENVKLQVITAGKAHEVTISLRAAP
jgi:S1-C subfamily serine protease